MCNRARLRTDPETLRETFGAKWLADVPNTPTIELAPFKRAPIIRKEGGDRVIDAMPWDVLCGMATKQGKPGTKPRPIAMTNVRNLHLRQWRDLVTDPAKRCLIPLTEFCEWTPAPDPVHKIKGEMWFACTDQPMFAVAGFWQPQGDKRGFTMVTCDPNELVAPIHPKAMITILAPEDHERWLTCPGDEVLALQRPYPADRMTVRGPVFPTRGRTQPDLAG
jgi:putative SOS response-associated peptidase YedK